jgi:phosphoribosyl 1,2-cyclic phosphodiesterase
LVGQPFQGTVLLSHLHWDHVHGIPFFAAGDRNDARTHVRLPAQNGRTGVELISGQMSPPAFPIRPEQLRGRWTFTATEDGVFEAEGFTVTAFDVAHRGGRTFGYRIDSAAASLGYVPDHAPQAGVSPAVLKCLAEVDLLIHDSQFLPAEQALADDYGHSTVPAAVEFAERVGARRLALFHHGPQRTDDELDDIARAASLSTTLPVMAAREGLVLDLPACPD